MAAAGLSGLAGHSDPADGLALVRTGRRPGANLAMRVTGSLRRTSSSPTSEGRCCTAPTCKEQIWTRRFSTATRWGRSTSPTMNPTPPCYASSAAL